MIPMRKLGQLADGEMRKRAAGLLESVGLGDKLRRPSRHLSGGQQQRVAIARALANNPRVILADEPTGNVDSRTGQLIIQLLKQLAEQGRTVIVVTHDRSIAGIADVRLQMEDGRIETMENYVPPVNVGSLSHKKKGCKR